MRESKMVRLPVELVARIDAVRRDVPRERWVRRTLETALDGPAEGAPVEGVRAAGAGSEKAPRSPERVPASSRASITDWLAHGGER